MIPWVRLAAAGIVSAALFGAGWTVNGWRLGMAISKLEADAFRMAAEARATESRWAEHVIKIGEDANAEAERLRAALARADAAAGRLHDAGSRHAAAAASAPGVSEAAAAAIHLHSDLRARAVEALRTVGKHADETRAAALTCVRADEVMR